RAHGEEHADLAAHVDVRLHHPVAVDAEASPAANGDVLTELADQSLPVFFDGTAAARIGLRADVRAGGRLRRRGHDRADELLEVLVASGEIRLDVHLGGDAALPVGGDEHSDFTLGRD